MVAAKPTGASALTVTPAPVALVSNENSTEPVAKNDAFDEIKNKFLNEIDKIPREFTLPDAPPALTELPTSIRDLIFPRFPVGIGSPITSLFGIDR